MTQEGVTGPPPKSLGASEQNNHPDGSTESIPLAEMVLTWCDSDMTNTKETSSDQAVTKNQGRGMQLHKFEAKPIGMWQVCCLGRMTDREGCMQQDDSNY
jgi:hypothetical protein